MVTIREFGTSSERDIEERLLLVALKTAEEYSLSYSNDYVIEQSLSPDVSVEMYRYNVFGDLITNVAIKNLLAQQRARDIDIEVTEFALSLLIKEIRNRGYYVITEEIIRSTLISICPLWPFC